MIDINKYLSKSYPYPQCWCLVTDFYLNEFDFSFKNIEVEGRTIEQLQQSFMISIKKDKLFTFTENASENAIVLMYKNYVDRPDHCGIFIQDRILHSLYTLSVWQYLFELKEFYSRIEFGVLNDH